MPLFGKSSKTPGEVVKQLKESLVVLEKQQTGDSNKKLEKAHDDVRNGSHYSDKIANYNDTLLCTVTTTFLVILPR